MKDILGQLSLNTAPGPLHEEDTGIDLSAEHFPVRAIAYYLPQFHSIPENDSWWGKGFTEWTNVTKAVPRFAGHYQPHLPGELGFYDLSHVDTLRKQARLARRYGIAGFCIHYYWFSGRKLLETPLNILLSNPDIDLPFCINWANESWTRRWDGSETHVLMKQDHSRADDATLARELERIVADPRYIRINGRPLIMVYRPGALTDTALSVRHWRDHFAAAGLPDPYFVMAQSFDTGDPKSYGMDAAAGFPPHVVGWDGPRLQSQQTLFDERYQGTVFHYDDLVDRALAHRPTGYRLFPGVCPQWDNEARKPGRGTSFIGSTPAQYGRWLARACELSMSAESADERIVFINAWNEWAEGAHLEPDRHFGHAYLAETARTLQRLMRGERPGDAPVSSSSPVRATERQTLAVRLRTRLRTARNKAARLADRLSDVLRSSY